MLRLLLWELDAQTGFPEFRAFWGPILKAVEGPCQICLASQCMIIEDGESKPAFLDTAFHTFKRTSPAGRGKEEMKGFL